MEDYNLQWKTGPTCIILPSLSSNAITFHQRYKQVVIRRPAWGRRRLADRCDTILSLYQQLIYNSVII